MWLIKELRVFLICLAKKEREGVGRALYDCNAFAKKEMEEGKESVKFR